LQQDYLSLRAREVIRRIPRSVNNSAARMLRGWDGVLSADSGPGALYVIWLERHLKPGIQAYLWPDDPQLFESIDIRNVMRIMEEGNVDNVVAQTLDAAYLETQNELGEDPSSWAWGAIHHTHFRHPLLDLADPKLARAMSMKDYPRGGSGMTTNATGYYDHALEVDSGASYRQVLDVGNWDAARATNAPGQSGDPRSPFYDNLLEGWATGSYFPLLYSREEIEKHRAFTIRLKPR
jgi:penicillin amidase